MNRATDVNHAQEERFVQAWYAFLRAMHKARSRFSREHGLELSIPQLQLLDALDEQALPICELAELAGLAPPTVTRMITGLVGNGVVTRNRSRKDRRIVIVRLTEKGQELLAKKRRKVEEKLNALFQSLSSEDREQAEQLLLKLADGMEEL